MSTLTATHALKLTIAACLRACGCLSSVFVRTWQDREWTCNVQLATLSRHIRTSFACIVCRDRACDFLPAGSLQGLAKVSTAGQLCATLRVALHAVRTRRQFRY